MKKRLGLLLALLLTVTAAVCLLSLSASAATYSGNCGKDGGNLTWSLDTSTGVLNITGTGAMADYFSTYRNSAYHTTAPWGTYDSYIRSVTIGNSVTSIGSYAFCGCNNLTSIAIPNSVTSIGNRAFYCCSSLTNITVSSGNESYCSIDGVLFRKDQKSLLCYPAGKRGSYTIPSGVTSIGHYAFYNCTNMTSITIPDSVTSIGSYAFGYCSGLTSVTIPDSVTSIGSYAFRSCSSLTSVTIGNSVTSIGNYAFYNCTNMTSITIPDSVTSIGSYAFYNCTNMTSITIPDSVTSIGYSAFSGCSRLTSVHITDLAAWCRISFGSSDANPLYYAKNLYINGLLATDITIPDGVTSIGSYAFSGYDGLTSINIPDSVMSIGYGAFWECSGLTSITIGNGVTSIGDGAFSGCTSLGSITVPTGNTAYCAVDGVLFNKNKTTLVCYPAGKTASSYTIPNSVTSIGDNAFSGCSRLTSVTIPDSVTSIGKDAFAQCYSLTSVTIGNGVTSIGSFAFYYCSKLTSVTIGNSVTSIGSYAFSGCSGLTSVHITDLAAWCRISFGSSNANPLSNAKNLYINGVLATDITIPDSVTSIGSSAFSGCRGLTSVTIPDGVTSIGSYAFDNCSSLTSITIPDSVMSIGSYAFYYCSKLTSITIGNGVTSIGNYAFYGSGLRTIRCIPGSYVDTYAQKNGYAVEYWNLTSVTLASPPTKTVYPINGTLKTNGLTLNVTLDDGSVVTVSSGFTVEAYDFSTAGQKTVSVACAGFTVSFTVTVDATLIEYPESDHPYANNTNQTWTYTHPTAADELHITFSADTKTESGYDYIYIYDASGAQVGKYSGTQLAGQTVIVEGNSFSIKLTSDGSGTYYGFAIDDITAVGGALPGDFDGDGSVTNSDITLLIRYLAGWTDVALDEASADVNHDGKVNNRDAIALIRIVAKWDE